MAIVKKSLVERLRFSGRAFADPLFNAAADRIEDLEKAMQEIASCETHHPGDVVAIARKSLVRAFMAFMLVMGVLCSVVACGSDEAGQDSSNGGNGGGMGGADDGSNGGTQ